MQVTRPGTIIQARVHDPVASAYASRMPQLIPEGRPSRPWGDDPPPAPSHATRRDRRQVRRAWGSWSPFRPYYDRQGDTIEAWIDLKGNGAKGTGRGATEEEAAWNALQDCIETWTRSIEIRIPSPVEWVRRLRGRRQERR